MLLLFVISFLKLIASLLLAICVVMFLFALGWRLGNKLMDLIGF